MVRNAIGRSASIVDVGTSAVAIRPGTVVRPRQPASEPVAR
jgi:hypothetical protein